MIVVFSEERQRFECICSYFERDVPKQERFRWDPAAKRWWARDEDIARRLAQYATGSAALRLNKLSAPESRTLADSMAPDAPPGFEIPAPAGLEYLPYQRAGIFYMLRRFGDLQPAQAAEKGGSTPSRGGVLLADEMG